MIDLDPLPPGGGAVIEIRAGDSILMGDGVVVHRSRSRYPDPPVKFEAGADVISMWERFELYRREPRLLTWMAHYCLTTLEASVGTKKDARRQAAKRYRIEFDILKRLGHLSSEVGDASLVRKRIPGQVLYPLTPAEVAWMEAVVKRLIQRVGEWAADPTANWPLITMGDFPRL